MSVKPETGPEHPGTPLTLSLPNVAGGKFDQISTFHHVKVQTESFHLNGHIIGFRLQTQELESPYKTPSNTLAVKGLITNIRQKITKPKTAPPPPK